ncbi:MAG: pilus assembly FimT family protein [Candidatus Saccharimonadales bacterium]
MHRMNKTSSGFTIVELMLSMAFVGSLLMVIALLIMQVMSIYNTGIAIKEVNAVSRIAVREVQQTVMNSDVFALRYHDADAATPETKIASSFDELKRDSGADFYTNSAGGRLCMGTYSYAWNTGRAIKQYNEDNSETLYEGNPIQLIRGGETHGNDRLVKFVKVRDGQKRLCKADSNEGEGARNYERYLPTGDTDAPYENVFGEGNNNLVLYRFEVDAAGDDGAVIGLPGRSLQSTVPYYTFSMVIGTQTGDELITTNETCSAPADAPMNNSEYCAVNKIDFVARSGAIGG